MAWRKKTIQDLTIDGLTFRWIYNQDGKQIIKKIRLQITAPSVDDPDSAITLDPSGVPSVTISWGDIVGTLSAQTDLQDALNLKVPTSHLSAHAPSDAQKNSDITKGEIEAKLTGVINTHSHAGSSSAPSGSILIYGGATAPSGWLLCDGTSYLQADYPDLFAIIGTAFGGDATNFNVPNYSGKFTRGKTGIQSIGATGGSDTHTHSDHSYTPGGSNSGGAVSSHTGTAVSDHSTHTHSVTSNVTASDHSSHTHNVTSNVAVGNHTAHTHSVTSNVSVSDHSAHTHSVTSNVAVGDHASHTHGYGTIAVAQHNATATGSASAGATQRGTTASTLTLGNHTHQTPILTHSVSGSTGNPSATLTHSVTNNAVTSGDPSLALSHSVTNNAVTSANESASLSHSLTNNAVTSGNESATLTHSVSQPSDHSFTQPSFTGTPATLTHSTSDNIPSYYAMNHIIKT